MEYTIKGENGYIKFILENLIDFPNTTSITGGYDCNGKIIIKSNAFYVEGNLYFSTGELFFLNKKIKESYKNLNGNIHFNTFENELEFNIEFENFGKFKILGTYIENSEFDNKLNFEIRSNQSYLIETIQEGNIIEEKYGHIENLMYFDMKD